MVDLDVFGSLKVIFEHRLYMMCYVCNEKSRLTNLKKS